MRYAVLFPGQGSQAVGMGGGVFDSCPDLLGATADEVLGWSLRGLCLDGPADELTRTDRAQPALFAVSYALWHLTASAIGRPPAAAAGHSLGEYTALAAAGAVSFRDGLSLVAERGRAMSAAAGAEPSSMAALIGADEDAAEQLAASRRGDGGRLWVANLNAPGQVVVAGGAADIEWVMEAARDHGIRRAVPLDVAGAFHSPFMEPAVAALEEALGATTFGELAFPVWANVTARPYGADDLPSLLVEQVIAPVRFAATIVGLAESGIEAFVHVGPGDVTAGLARRSVQEVRTLVVSGIDDIESAAEALAA